MIHLSLSLSLSSVKSSHTQHKLPRDGKSEAFALLNRLLNASEKRPFFFLFSHFTLICTQVPFPRHSTIHGPYSLSSHSRRIFFDGLDHQVSRVSHVGFYKPCLPVHVALFMHHPKARYQTAVVKLSSFSLSGRKSF